MSEFEIKRVKTAGKWMEYWFVDVPPSSLGYDQCSKQYMLGAVVEKAELDDHVLNHGFVGMVVTWPVGSDRPTAIRKPGMTEQEDAAHMLPMVEG